MTREVTLGHFVIIKMETNIIEVDNETGYALWAKSYDHEKNPLVAVEEPHVAQLLKGISYSHVLDAGTGTGRHALRIARHGIHVTAIDNSPEMLDAARGNAYRSDLDIDFQQGSLEDRLPFDADSFDLVLCSLVLTHIPNLSNVVKEFHRVCRKDGHVLVADFHPDSLVQGWRTEFKMEGTTYQLPNMKYTREDYLEAVCNAGFKLIKVKDIPTAEIPKGYVSEETINTYANVGLCLIILGQKK